MKILLTYPPLDKQKGVPLLSQNRQFQYFKEPTYIYPVVPASAATLLKQAGHQVIWLDCIAEGISYDRFLEVIRREKPDLIAMETKTPVVKQHWKIINDLKGLSPKGTDPNTKGTVPNTAGTVPKIALFGDHVTALPEESFQNSAVDYILTGGDYDFLLLNLCNFLKSKGLSPQMANPKGTNGTVPETKGTVPEYSLQLEPGIYYRANGQINPSTTLRINGEQSRTIKNTGLFQLDHNLDTLPFIDRDLTKWQLYAYENGNYKRTPGTYIMSGRDCWYHACSFCSWRTLYTNYRIRNPELVANEIGFLISNYNIKTIFDDTGTFPIGNWLREFCQLMIDRGYNKKIDFSCNARFGSLNLDDYNLMKRAGFRMLLFGLESANQHTLDKINKNLKVEKIIADCKSATKAGLFPHITIMFGYPWETYEETLKTLKLGRWLLNKGYAYTMQATVVIPYPGTPLFQEGKEKGWLKTLNWEDYDMKQPVMETSIADDRIMKLAQAMYKVSFQPEFILRKLFSLKDIDDLKYSLRAVKKVFGHI